VGSGNPEFDREVSIIKKNYKGIFDGLGDVENIMSKCHKKFF